MKKILAVSIFLVVTAELMVLRLPERGLVLVISGATVGFGILALRWLLNRGMDTERDERGGHDPGAALLRWLSRTETLIARSETTRSDWDRHLRPMLARQFVLATGGRQSKDPAAFQATGRMLFGAELWQWVDPENVAPEGDREPGPGRRTLDAILQRLEQV